MRSVIVIGCDHHNTLGVIRSLGEKGIRPDAVIVSRDGKSFVGKSKYIRKMHIVYQNSEVTPYLLSHLKQNGEKSVVICCHDGASSEIDLHSDELKEYFMLPGAEKQGQITKLMSKQVMSDLAQKCGFSLPKTIYPQHLPLNADEVYLPCIVKPLVSKNGTKDDIRICENISEANEAVEKVGIGNVQLQQFIDKDFEYQLIGVSTGKDVVIPGVSRILRPCKGSNTSFLHYTPLEDDFCDIEKCKEFVRLTGYHGLFSLEFLRDKNGQDYFMEINFRNDGNAICVTAAGMSLPYIWYLDCLGNDYSNEANKEIKSVYVMPDMAELKLLVTRQISLREYISDFKKTNRFMEYDKRDSKPFWKLVIFHICSRLGI